jgi:hypothetical protein
LHLIRDANVVSFKLGRNFVSIFVTRLKILSTGAVLTDI